MHRLEGSELDDLYRDLGVQRPRQLGSDVLNSRYNNLGAINAVNNEGGPLGSSFRINQVDLQQQQQQPSNVIRQTTTKSSSIIRKKKKTTTWLGYSQTLLKEFCYGAIFGFVGYMFNAFNQYRKLKAT
ncbi:hypothetical protein PPL_06225 [Heterostelium album PN500]|uniref:Uncharacterized protein n=1 Tax=Heterostelium pallidum (strain ATCC 26659 / Pp 5 / PN500) TaxID=670386 RepID=D3BCK0_HETP5|nr:hypothetical protein PPL_06225 [Heterostelium album PN500]EFA80642.1 hypothetical protein PPL_06225 [Heterostelium album PN500]|eukprot:XP_020432762.1 hypothetical protein PPL_06225 [Heterostelium album PN500]